MRPRILIVDDRDDLRGDLCEVVSTKVPECRIEQARNQTKAIELINRKLFPLVITDINLDEAGGEDAGGFAVLEAAKERDPAIQVIVITSYPQPEHVQRIRAGGGFGYVDRAKYVRREPEGNDDYEYWQELLGFEARDALQEYELAKARTHRTVTVVIPEHTLESALLKNAAAGIGSLFGQGGKIECNSLSQFAGRHLWERTFGDRREVLLSYGEAVGRVSHPSHVIIRIQSGSEDLDIPFELLHDASGYLGLRHPLVRVAPGSRQSPPQPTWDELLDQIGGTRGRLRMLLVAADPGDGPLAIPKVDAEVNAVAAAARELGVEATVIHSPDASAARVREEFSRRWHVVHYAGHGSFDANDPENSSIYFRDGAFRTAELSHLLERHPPSLLYLNCCHSARSGAFDCLAFSKSLGLADSAVRAGVPAVISHRWPVRDDDVTVAFVESFYRELLSEYPPERALLSARKAIQQKDSFDSAWSSAVMVVQEN
jgi:CheY-like chemotaxis protein